MSERVPINEAARELGVAPQSVREHMRRGIWDLGAVVPPEMKGGRWGFHVYREKLDRHLGKGDTV